MRWFYIQMVERLEKAEGYNREVVQVSQRAPAIREVNNERV